MGGSLRLWPQRESLGNKEQTCQPQDGPDAEEADDADDDRGRGLFHRFQEVGLCTEKQ